MQLVLLIFLFLHSEQAASAGTQLSDLALFRRCYSQLTGLPVPLNNDSYLKIKNKSLNGLTACSNLIDQVVIDPQTGLLVDSNSKESLAILNQMHALHRSWFISNSVEQIQGYGTEIGLGTVDVYDATEPSLAITRAVFTDQAKYSDVLTLGTGVQALREDNSEIVKRQNFIVKNPGRIFVNSSNGEANLIEFRGTEAGGAFSDNSVNTFVVPVPYIQAGDLKGVRKITTSLKVPNFSFLPLSGNPATDSAHLIPDLNSSFDLYETLGGGVLGTPIYLMMNYGRELGTPSNGSTKVPRRWAQTNLNTFLCQSLPSLRESDIRNLVKVNSPTPFRNGTSCVSCHATLDQMAYTARNVVIAGSNYMNTNSPGNFSKATLLMSTFKQLHPSVGGWPDTEIPNFNKQTPSGKLFFRSATGELVDQKVNSIKELGEALVETDDYYLCAAKRYYEFFTGKDISLYDRTNPDNARLNKVLTTSDIKNRAFIESLAQKLKKDQSVKELIKNIMSSEDYRQKDFGL